MKNKNSRHGKREAVGQPSVLARYWARYRSWLAGLNKGQRVRYRLLQAATIVAVVVLAVFLSLRAWIQVPELPGFGGGTDELGELAGDVFFDGAEIPDIVRSGRQEGKYTFLLVGKDVASGSTDTMLLLTYDVNEKKIYGLNLPRDTMVNVSTTSKRLNAVYNYNKGKDKETQVEKGMAALKKEVANLTGITPDFYVLVEWEAVGKLVDALGGVEFEVPFDMAYKDPYQDLYIYQEAGLRVLTGDDAMQVVRWRKNNDGGSKVSGSDIVRLSIQQDFLKAVAKKCLQPATFLKLPELVQIFKENVTTDLTLGNILAFAQLAYGMDPDTGVSFSTAPLADSFLYKSAALVTLDPAGILEIVNEGMNPYLRDIAASDLKIVVRNGNGSFSVTNSTLADAAMGQVPAATSKPETGETGETEAPIETEEPIGTEGPENNGQEGSGSQGENLPAPPNSGSGEDPTPPNSGSGEDPAPPNSSSGEDPAPPDENQQPPESGNEGQTGEENPSGGGGTGTIDPSQVFPDPNDVVSQDIRTDTGSVMTLPTRPEPVEQAA